MPSARYWREVPNRYRLEAGRCTGCGKVIFPARRVCPACRGTEHETVRLSPEGSVVTATVVRTPADDLQMESPFAVAIVETPEGARFMTQVVDCDPEAVRPGMAVSLEFRLVRKEGHGGIRCYGHKAVPVAEA